MQYTEAFQSQMMCVSTGLTLKPILHENYIAQTVRELDRNVDNLHGIIFVISTDCKVKDVEDNEV